MLSSTHVRVAAVAVAMLLSGAAIAIADPGEEHGHDGIPVPAPTLPLTPPGSSNFTFLDAVDKDGTINSDLAFHGDTHTRATTTASGSSTSPSRTGCAS